MTTANWAWVLFVAFLSVDATIFAFCSVWTGYQSKFSFMGILRVLFVEKFRWDSLKVLASVGILLGGPAFFFLLVFQLLAGRHGFQTLAEQVSRIEDSLPLPLFAISCLIFLVGYILALLTDKEDFKHSCHLCGKKKMSDSVYCNQCEAKLGVKGLAMKPNSRYDYFRLVSRYGFFWYFVSWAIVKSWNAMSWALDEKNEGA
jgi:hypothetical protein